MVYNSEIHHRRSVRVKGYDYSQDEAYFVTVCAYNKQCLFGNIAGRKMELNGAGEMVDCWWRRLSEKFPETVLDKYEIMPNHFHVIIVVRSVGAIPCNRPISVVPVFKRVKQNMGEGENMVSPVRIQNTYDGLGRYVSWFKRMTTNEYIHNVKSGKFPVLEKTVWQRNYYEHIIRGDDDLDRIREYIANNPINWEIDKLYSRPSG